jgi:hypothetical protein
LEVLVGVLEFGTEKKPSKPLEIQQEQPLSSTNPKKNTGSGPWANPSFARG